MGPVWEANHVWLIFVLVICGPRSRSRSARSSRRSPSRCSSRRSGSSSAAPRSRCAATATDARGARLGGVFALSSVLIPFSLGAAIGGIASGRVPVGNAAGDLLTSWLNPTSILIGMLAVATGAYLAAVYLAGDVARQRDEMLTSAFRPRALASGFVAGATAVGGLAVSHRTPACSSTT